MSGGSKWKSRKFWESVIGAIVGIIAMFGGPQWNPEPVVQIVTVVSGAVLTLLCILGYLKAEKDVDVERERTKQAQGKDQ